MMRLSKEQGKKISGVTKAIRHNSGGGGRPQAARTKSASSGEYGLYR